MKYEHISILKGTLTKEEVDKEDENFKTFFKDNNITVDLAENKGLKKLAYEIRKNRQGYFLRYEIETEDSNIFKLEKYARENQNIIKFITIRISENEQVEEIKLLEKVLRKHKIYDIEVYYTPKTHKLIAKDKDNKWKEKEFYEFLFNEVFNYDENGIVDLLDKEDDEKLKYFRNKHQ